MSDTPTALSAEILAIREAMGMEIEAKEVARAKPEGDVWDVPAPTLLRQYHHQIARYLAQGRKPEDISALTGYSPTYISNLKKSPAFAELVKHYDAEQEAVFISVAESLKDLGVVAIEELKERILANPKDFPRGQLLELIELIFGKQGGARAAGIEVGRSSGPGVAVQITFAEPSPAPDSKIIDVVPRVLPHVGS